MGQEEKYFEKENFLLKNSFIFQKKDQKLITSIELNKLETIFSKYENSVRAFSLYSMFSGFIERDKIDSHFTGMAIDISKAHHFFEIDLNSPIKNLDNGIAISEKLSKKFQNSNEKFRIFVLGKDFENMEINSLSVSLTATFRDIFNREFILIPTNFAEPLLQNGLANRGVFQLSSLAELSEIEYQLSEFGFEVLKPEKTESFKPEVYILFLALVIFSILLPKRVQKMEWLSLYYNWSNKKVFFLKFFENLYPTLIFFTAILIVSFFLESSFLISFLYISLLSVVYFLAGIFKK
jgi:hypothetical protein